MPDGAARARVVGLSEDDASLFATLLLSDLWTAANEQAKGTDEADVKPFYVDIDEFQNFVTPTIAKNLDQARGFGLIPLFAVLGNRRDSVDKRERRRSIRL